MVAAASGGRASVRGRKTRFRAAITGASLLQARGTSTAKAASRRQALDVRAAQGGPPYGRVHHLAALEVELQPQPPLQLEVRRAA